MPAGNEILSSLGLEPLVAGHRFKSDVTGGVLTSPSGARVVFAGSEMMQSLYRVVDRDRPGTWASSFKSAGYASGKKFAAELDARLAALGKPSLAGLPLEACLVFLEDYFAAQGLGRLKLDLGNAAEHGVVVAHLENSFFANALSDVAAFADPMPAGLLQGFFEHLSGQGLGCEEIACGHHGAPHCTFVLTAPERLAAIAKFFGRETAESLIARLCA